MSAATRTTLSSALKRNLPRRPLLLPHQRGLAALTNDTIIQPSDEHPANELLRNTFKPHHPVTTAVSWGEEFWRNVPAYGNVSSKDFLSYRWSLHDFLNTVVPDEIPDGAGGQSKEEFLVDVHDGVKASAMSIRITQVYFRPIVLEVRLTLCLSPYLLSRINWQDPRNDPIFRQFIPLKSMLLPDHPKLTIDPLEEEADEPVKGLVHRYPDKALFLAVSVCPTYCIFCTRARAVGADTLCVTKQKYPPGRRRWDEIFTYIEANPQLQDIVISGGDSFYIEPEHIRMIGDRLIKTPHIRRFRFASKGLAVAPMRFVDPADDWTNALIEVSQRARDAGKSMALHTHFNHPNEISWITEAAAQRLHKAGVTVRNQSVLLKSVNDNVQTMSTLIRKLSDINVTPYYVYICDMVQNSEHHRTTLQTLLDLEAQITGSIAGFNMPKFVVDLPGGGGKRLGSTRQSYDRETGVSRFEAPAVTGAAGGREKPKVFEYYDPIVHDNSR
ncbi:hypothetical protein diail_9401 [Diaporthe ilicicola]|nr:hypothetical protein diail_9401 [Diaporthe ilicicola]